jgi:REP element-mobilizing transposase RayT
VGRSANKRRPKARARPSSHVAREALIAATSSRFRVLQFSVQRDHLHLLVEASTPTGFERGVRGLAIRVARAVNRALARRGSVWGDRYHSHVLRTPREVRNALVYVLNNWGKHEPGTDGLDPRSSAAWFEGWRKRRNIGTGIPPVAKARTWLASVGWKLRGLIGLDERPRA